MVNYRDSDRIWLNSFGEKKISRSDLSRSFFEINTGKNSSKTTKNFRKLAKILVKIFFTTIPAWNLVLFWYRIYLKNNIPKYFLKIQILVVNLTFWNDCEWSDLDHDRIVAHFIEKVPQRDSDWIWLIILTKDSDRIWLLKKRIVQCCG